MATEKEATLMISPVFVGLTRPPMLLGVTMDYLGITIMIALCGFILLSNPLYLLIDIPLHVMGVIACAIDHNIFRLLFKKLDCLNVPNKRIWGCQSYAPY
jgi:type IV secretion system protein VirB3